MFCCDICKGKKRIHGEEDIYDPKSDAMFAEFDFRCNNPNLIEGVDLFELEDSLRPSEGTTEDDD